MEFSRKFKGGTDMKKVFSLLFVAILLILILLINTNEETDDLINSSLIPNDFKAVQVFMYKSREDAFIRRKTVDTHVINDITSMVQELIIEEDIYPEEMNSRYGINLINSSNENVSISFYDDNIIWYRYNYKIKDGDSINYIYKNEFTVARIINSEFDIGQLEDNFLQFEELWQVIER